MDLMQTPGFIAGFSRLGRDEKARLAAEFSGDPGISKVFADHLHPDKELQKLYDALTENAVSNYYLPFSIAPNFLVNGVFHMVPMVTEESSVVAAASSAAKFWSERGGFHARVLSKHKPGHVHFVWKGEKETLVSFVEQLIPGCYEVTAPVLRHMKSRGGGILSIRLRNQPEWPDGYYQLEVIFDTADAMGANLINSCLEIISRHMAHQAESSGISEKLEVIMAILSNYSPGCLVECLVTADVNRLDGVYAGMNGLKFSEKFCRAVDISHLDVYRAVTHNKGIFNGIDAVMIATGNDFRAVEASAHAYAARNGKYAGLSEARISGKTFTFRLELPMMAGTVGGLTKIHPMAVAALKMLGNPNADELMAVIAAAGLAANFSAIRALITDGIQKGHMRLHLVNLLQQLGASAQEQELAAGFFHNKTVSQAAVKNFLHDLRTRESIL
jgi:hydroxymethylglutaryl-CoA reductase